MVQSHASRYTTTANLEIRGEMGASGHSHSSQETTAARQGTAAADTKTVLLTLWPYCWVSEGERDGDFFLCRGDLDRDRERDRERGAARLEFFSGVRVKERERDLE